MKYELVCTRCGNVERDGAFRCGRCNAVLEVKIDYSSVKLGKRFAGERPRNSKYLPLFPINGFHIRSDEGGTPMIMRRIGSDGIMLKLESENPTGSFKDRGSSVEINKAIELGAESVCCASTGNMGISVARYARLAGIRATIFVSRDANARKMAMIKKHKARLVEVDGDFNASIRKAEKFAGSTGAFVCGDYHFRKEGQKSVLFEIMDQLRHRVPDFIFLPVGNATLLAAMYKALSEYRRFKLIRAMPRLVAVQSDRCDPLVNAYNSGKNLEYTMPRTAADAIAVGYPTFGLEGINALRKTRGIALKVSEDRMKDSVIMLGEIGIDSEMGGAAGFASAHRSVTPSRCFSQAWKSWSVWPR